MCIYVIDWHRATFTGACLVLHVVAGIPILAVGATVAALGGITNVGATVSEMVLKRKEVKHANEWILQNQQYCQRLVEEYLLFEAELDCAKEFPDWDFDGLLGNVLADPIK